MSSLTVGNPAQVESSDVSNHVAWYRLSVSNDFFLAQTPFLS